MCSGSRPRRAECSLGVRGSGGGSSSPAAAAAWQQELLLCARRRIRPQRLIQQEHRRTTLLIWMCKTRQSSSVAKQICDGFKALQLMCCLLTFIPCNYHSPSLGENDNALGFKALRRAQYLRVLTFLVLIGWIACSGSPLKLVQQHWKPKQAWLENHWKGSYLVCILHHEIDSGPIILSDTGWYFSSSVFFFLKLRIHKERKIY